MMLDLWICIGILFALIILLTAGLGYLSTDLRGLLAQVMDENRRLRERHFDLKNAYENHRDDTRKNMKKFRRELDRAQGALAQMTLLTTPVVLLEKQPPLETDEAEYVYQVNLGALVSVTAPPTDPDLRAILWENFVDVLDNMERDDPSLIDHFELVEARAL